MAPEPGGLTSWPASSSAATAPGWDDCPHPWIARYRTPGGRSSRQREQSFGDDRKEAEDFLLKIEHDKKARVFIDPKAGSATFRAEAEAWLAHHLGADSSISTYQSVLRAHVYPAIGDRQIRVIRREDVKALIAATSPVTGLRSSISPSIPASVFRSCQTNPILLTCWWISAIPPSPVCALTSIFFSGHPRRRRAKEIVLGTSNGAVMIKGILAAWPHL
jgi:hypothetical protein